jgi:signal transduction histidine kinase
VGYRPAWDLALVVEADDREIRVEVTDDGVGGAEAEAPTGIHGMQSRVEELRGRLEVASPAGGGTLVRGRLPHVYRGFPLSLRGDSLHSIRVH